MYLNTNFFENDYILFSELVNEVVVLGFKARTFRDEGKVCLVDTTIERLYSVHQLLDFLFPFDLSFILGIAFTVETFFIRLVICLRA